MAPPRHDEPGAWHHVMNRGARREAIFRNAGDARRFLDLLGELADRHGVEIHAFCLMTNHFHLLLRSVEADLAGLMQQLGSTYTREVNRRFGHDGAIFRGRYRSKRVDTDSYLVTAARYIHRNPTSIEPAVQLDAYRWSSYGAVLGLVEPPPWLHLDEVPGRYESRTHLREHVEGRAHISDLDELTTIAEFALDEQFFDLDIVRLTRPLLLAIADELELDFEGDDHPLAFPTPGARRTGMSRMRAQLRDSPAFAAAFRRTLDNAA